MITCLFFLYFFPIQGTLDEDLLDQLCSSEDIWNGIQFPELPDGNLILVPDVHVPMYGYVYVE